MKTDEKLNKIKAPIVAIDDSLNKYREKVLFKSKLEKANNMLKTAILPSIKSS
jgi:hypothetical protein